eukprot:TRINITY_DN1002_c0_g1_i5.p1 TRINITY_DN1002_c0_g1~~TRINITY_DN1002_c0_g1_i5.p1  ORF type:complete len:659 (+),score=78.50 TRINITY_DN1002_c0_g1_i5:557-2533(+)
MAEIGIFILEAIVGVVIEKTLNPNVTPALIEEVRNLTSTVVGLQHQVASLEGVIARLTDRVPDEVLRFRRVRQTASRHLGDFDPTVVDFATELVASLLNGLALGFQLKVYATKKDPNRGRGFEASDFEVVLGATKTVDHNILLLKRFINDLTHFVDFREVSRLEKPTITVNMVCGSTIHFKSLELMRYRIALRLNILNTLALNWSTSCLGTLELNGVRFGEHDDWLCKFVNNTQMDCNLHAESFPRVFQREDYRQMTEVLRRYVRASVSCFRVLFLSFDDWITDDASAYDSFSSNIRTFVSGGTTRCVEVKLKHYSHWDHINLEQILFWGLSMGVVVFRFATVEDLAQMLEASTQITVKYPRLTDEVQRVVYVETLSTDNVGDLRQEIKSTAGRGRLLEPRDEEDILFEKSYSSTRIMMEYIRRRGQSVGSIMNNDVKGEFRDVMTTMARVLNKEVTREEAARDTEAVMQFASKITQHSVASKIHLYRDDREMVLCSGDNNTPFLLHTGGHVRDGDYVDFRSIPMHSTIQLSLTLRLYGVDQVWQHFWLRKWMAFDDVKELAHEKSILLAPIFEEKATKSMGMRSRPIVSRVSVCAMGGNDWDDYLHARLQHCVMNVSGLERKEAGWTALRVVLKLIPELREFSRSQQHSAIGRVESQ